MTNIAGTTLEIGNSYVCQDTEVVGLMVVLSSVIKNCLNMSCLGGEGSFLGLFETKMFSRWCAAGFILFENVLRLGCIGLGHEHCFVLLA